MDLKKKVINTILHVSAWMLLISFSFLLDLNFGIDIGFLPNLLRVALYATIFYTTYYWLMPLLYKKKMVSFILFTLLMLTGASFIKQEIIMHRMDEIRNERFESPNEMRMPPADIFDYEMIGPKPKKKPPRPGMVINFTSLMLFYVLAFSFRFIKKWQDDEELKSALEKQKVDTELQYLKQQINPHFLFNSLNSIYSLSLTKSEQTTNSILKLSSILRYMLYESEDYLVSLKNEINTVRDYIDLQKLRITSLVDVDFKIIGEANGYKIAPFILIPIIENAFKYGTDTMNKSFISIHIMVDSTMIHLVVENKIVSTPKDKVSSGIGHKNIKRRLELLYLNDYLFDIQSKEGVYKVTLQLKLRK